MHATPPCVLTIGGLDPSGGAGLSADARAVQAFGAHPCPILTAVIAQNTTGVARIEPVEPAMLAAQLDNLLADIAPAAVKIGLLPTAQAAEIVGQRLQALPGVPVVLDTVFAPSSGPRFCDAATMMAIVALLPQCDIVTPNLLEAAHLCGAALPDRAAMRVAARHIHERFGPANVLLKGGHLPPLEAETSDANAVLCDALDVFCDGEHLVELRLPRVPGAEVRGTGCLLASALAALRAQGVPPLDAAWRAKAWLSGQIAQASAIGHGRRVATGPF